VLPEWVADALLRRAPSCVHEGTLAALIGKKRRRRYSLSGAIGGLERLTKGRGRSGWGVTTLAGDGRIGAMDYEAERFKRIIRAGSCAGRPYLRRIADMLRRAGARRGPPWFAQEEVLPELRAARRRATRPSLWAAIADVLEARGQLDEALRIRREDELPVYERLGDVREKAITMGKIADVLQDRGQLDEALRIRLRGGAPRLRALGDVRGKAVTLGKIADVLQARGQLDEALRIRREEELPVYERLGDVRNKAVTLGKIADVLAVRGQLDEALRIRREEELPALTRLGDVRELLAGQANLAATLLRTELPEHLPEARALLLAAEAAARTLGLPAELEAIRSWFPAAGLPPTS
jgi:tetratricopeptide (TPR) repeat protein